MAINGKGTEVKRIVENYLILFDRRVLKLNSLIYRHLKKVVKLNLQLVKNRLYLYSTIG